MNKYEHGIKKVFDDGREIHLMCDGSGESWGIRAVTPVPQEDERRVGCKNFDIEAHRKFMIKEVDGNIVSQMGISEEALHQVVLMFITLKNKVGESK